MHNPIKVTYPDSFRKICGLSTATDRAYALENEVRKMPQAEFPLDNYFAPGVYLCSMLIRKNHVLVGAVHKTRHIALVAKGCIAIDTEQGVKLFKAGDIFISEPGAKRSGWALEDTLFINVHANPDNETHYPTLVEKLTTSKYEDLLESKHKTLDRIRLKEL
jgi:hypothetical protein